MPEGCTKGRRGTALDPDQFRLFIATVAQMAGVEIAGDVARLILILAWTGMRMGEARALRWSDLQDGELYVQRSVWRGEEKCTKTDDPRLIALVEPATRVLEEQRQWLLTEQHPGLASGLVFPTGARHAQAGASRRHSDEVRWFRSGSVLNEALAKITAKAKLPPISPHSLRRTWEGLLRQAGVDQLVRRAMAGWRSERAQAIYSSVARSERNAAVDAVRRIVLEPKKKKRARPDRSSRVHPEGTPDSKTAAVSS